MSKGGKFIGVAVVVNVLLWGVVIANLKIDKACSTVDQTCETVRYSLMGATLWEAPGK